MRGKNARQPTGPAAPFAYIARTATALTKRRTERQYGHGFYGNGYGNGYGERKHNAGNQV